MSSPEISVKVGVMGVGALGGDVIDKLQYLGFPVCGYGYSIKSATNYPYFSRDRLQEFLNEVNILICLLPLTADTENLLNKDFFQKCQKGTFLINVARGKHLVDQDLLNALNSGQISGALLDVFRKEPLSDEHPFWNHEKIQITPHIASVTNPHAAAPQVIENMTRLDEGRELLNVVNRIKGY